MDSELQHIADKVRSGRRIAAAEAFTRLPSSSDSTITPLVDCATYL